MNWRMRLAIALGLAALGVAGALGWLYGPWALLLAFVAALLDLLARRLLDQERRGSKTMTARADLESRIDAELERLGWSRGEQ